MRRLLVAMVAMVVMPVSACFHARGSSSREVDLRLLESSTLDANNPQIRAAQFLCTSIDGIPIDSVDVKRCTPCAPATMLQSGDMALAHARALREQLGTAPYDASDHAMACVKYAYELALRDTVQALNELRSRKLETALFMTGSAAAAHRRTGLETIDATLDTMLARRDSAFVIAALDTLAHSVYRRAMQMYVRPLFYPLTDIEKSVHHLLEKPLTFRQLPAIPRTSDQLGESEAMWAANLFARLAELQRHDVAAHERAVRLSLAPLVLLQDWRAVDSAALLITSRDPADSVAPLAHALAEYRQQPNVIRAQPMLMALFDDAMRRMPRADSAALDAFDLMLTDADDQWRYTFLPSLRDALDTRAWAVIDPLWLTPVNEMRLERRARAAEAGFLYAHLTVPGQSGSETNPGRILIKRGRPENQWSYSPGLLGEFRYVWPGRVTSLTFTQSPVLWRAFYSDIFSLERLSGKPAPENAHCGGEDKNDLLTCAIENSADFRSVPFYGKMDTIDVTLARFRHSLDSVDLYVSSRLPLRSFRTRDAVGVTAQDSIRYGLWIANESGNVSLHREHTIPLPRASDIASMAEWRVRVGYDRTMHRVEALDAGGATGARGWRRWSNEGEASFTLKGFGMSDIMTGDSIISAGAGKRWSDVRMRPNGGVIAPNMQLAMAWETYDLKADTNGVMRWKVTIRREDGLMQASGDVRGVIVGESSAIDKVVGLDPNASTLAFTREERARPVVLDYLHYRTTGLPPGNHVLTLTIEDLVAKRSTTRTIAFRVLAPNAQLRFAPNGRR